MLFGKTSSTRPSNFSISSLLIMCSYLSAAALCAHGSHVSLGSGILDATLVIERHASRRLGKDLLLYLRLFLVQVLHDARLESVTNSIAEWNSITLALAIVRNVVDGTLARGELARMHATLLEPFVVLG